jgi:hypothetical protein
VPGVAGLTSRAARLALLLAVVLALWPAAMSKGSIRTGAVADYEVVFQWVHAPSGTRFLAIRRFVRESRPYLLLVNPQTLESSVQRATTLTVEGPADLDGVRETPFGRALLRYTAPPYRLRNYGATHAVHSVDGMYLTVDLCPSTKPLDRAIFRQARNGTESPAPIPVAIAISGRWMEHHPEDLAWLQEQVGRQRLEIIWVNHSYDHPHTPKVPLEHNFLLAPGVNFHAQVLRTEVALLERRLVPSPFFRFPGLVANAELIDQLRALSLIPVGTDAWLAKGQRPRSGSFILVHGNGNEPAGVTRLLRLMHARPDIALLPLPTAFADR